MDLSLTDDQREITAAFARFFERECGGERVRAAEEADPPGFDAELWKQLSGMGLVEMALPDSGLGLVDLALVCEQAGAHLAPVPFVEALVAARLLGDATPLATVALHPARHGVARLVPGGAVAEAVVVADGDSVVVAAGPHPAPANLGSGPVADVPVAGARTLPLDVAAWERAVDEWRVLTSAALAGLARAALTTAVEYVKEREQFGVPVGSFQAVQHRLADVATAVDGAELVARQAASDPTPLNASMAMVHCARTADDATAAALHFHGGYGFMTEYDVQLAFRRARAWRLPLGSVAREEAVLADRLFGEGG